MSIKAVDKYIPKVRGMLNLDLYGPINLALIAFFAWLVFSRFSFGYGLLNGCLPADFYMIDHANTLVSRGSLIAFNMPKTVRFINEGEKVIKIVAGVGGDKLRITMDGVYNGTKFYAANARRISHKYQVSPKLIERELVVPDGEVFLIGQTDHSWDSRFWGTVKLTSVIGTTYAIF
ncbi:MULTISPECIES: signal peptidase I [Buttiauxella]|jgi:conjugal transfer pilin signal peptidase TrbI|uniref:Signal peptidase I n=1 Tax=Buttiauxella agrestis TaxID=82977 RepID=A0A381KP64_9ENTR|nr:signal peptidase I [Buttiauxella agrestis]SUY92792.1 Type IV secretory pathway, protease TraF [Buttiauxella agrestis]